VEAEGRAEGVERLAVVVEAGEGRLAPALVEGQDGIGRAEIDTDRGVANARHGVVLSRTEAVTRNSVTVYEFAFPARVEGQESRKRIRKLSPNSGSNGPLRVRSSEPSSAGKQAL